MSELGRKKGGAQSTSGPFPQPRSSLRDSGDSGDSGSTCSVDGADHKGQFCEMFFRNSKQRARKAKAEALPLC